MPIKDLSPKDANSGGRIIKNMRICGSGLYEYRREEAPLMGLDIPDDYTGDTFKVFRSPEVLNQSKDLYARVPIITGHHVRVTTANAKQLAVGLVGDTVQSEIDPKDGETYLYTTGTIITGDGIEAYERYGELSVGYDPIVEWAPGDYKGQPYQAVLKGFNEINHILICKTARGGHQCMIMDEMPQMLKNNGGEKMKIFKKIFGSAPKPMTGDAAVVSALLQSIKRGADAKAQVEVVKGIMGDAVDATLKDYFDELSGDEAKSADKETVAKAVDVVDAYCAKLFGDEVKAPTPPAKEKEPVPAPEEKKDEKKEPEKKATPVNGDAKDLDSYVDKIADAVIARLKTKGVEPNTATNEKQAGDELEVSRLQALLAGDEKSEVNSDAVMKGIWG